LSSKKLRSKLQPPPSTSPQMLLVLSSLLSPQAQPLSPDIQISQQSLQAQLIQLQQSPPQVQQLPQAQLMQLLPPQVQLSQQSPYQVQQSPQAQLIQPPSQVQLLQQLLPLLQHSQLILSPFSLQQSFLSSIPIPQYNWAFRAQPFQSYQPTLYNLYQTLPYISTQSYAIQSNLY
ncbi:8228_t:CDS:2, partial [Racocetra persica]